MSDFPLYNTLISKLAKKDLTVLEKTQLIKKIPQLDLDTKELIYALIEFYYIKNSENVQDFPYECKINDENIEFDLLKLPHELKQMLFKFVSMHNKKLIEDEKLKETIDKIKKV